MFWTDKRSGLKKKKKRFHITFAQVADRCWAPRKSKVMCQTRVHLKLCCSASTDWFKVKTEKVQSIIVRIEKGETQKSHLKLSIKPAWLRLCAQKGSSPN